MSRLMVCSPLGFEARAVRKGIGADCDVRRTGYGARRSARQADRLRADSFEMLAVAGVGGALTQDLVPGDLVVGTEVDGPDGLVSSPSAVLLAGELRRAGLRVQAGKIATVPRLALGSERARLAGDGALAADLESAVLLRAAAGRPAVVVRAVSDGPQHPLVSPQVLAGGLAALRSLRQAAPALARWAAAGGARRVLLAAPRSFCSGVERAIEIVERALDQSGQQVYVRKQIVHNSRVVAGLTDRGAVFVDELGEVPDGARVVFSAHGVSPAVRAEAARRGLDTIDATCPLVAKVHAEARRFAAEGNLVVLIGHAGHEEVEGTLGEAPGSMVLVQNAADVAALRPADPGKIVYLMQTTLSADEAGEIVAALLEAFPAARGPGSDDICYATTNRQLALRAIAAESDLVLVAGSANSSNSRRLVETAERVGTPAYLIDRVEDIELGWLTGASAIGITAGASAPPEIVSEIVAALSGLGPVEQTERITATESIQFGLPKEVR
ncbi:MAG TPA: 4-hydroxy-3-methylbut-2-enyl diphosphate reductase [Streptosporangiaceae bacterium]|nr:4-hydroxy-3-methylbut-2-enyl diphosphate reductase [Streptosporangiaceae bacterium]